MKKSNKTLLELLAGGIFAISTIYACNRLVTHFSTSKELLLKKGGSYFKHRNASMFYQKLGSGSPLLLLHDLNCESAGHEWEQVAKEFAKEHTVYIVDLPGCGRSEKPAITYTSYFYVQILTDFVREIISDAPDVIATGNSASIAVMMECMKPELLRSLTLVNPLALLSDDTLETTNDKYVKQLLELPIIGTAIYHMYASFTPLFHRARTSYFSKRSSKATHFLRRCHEASHLCGSASKYLFASQTSHCMMDNASLAIKGLKLPIHIILGGDLSDIEALEDCALTICEDAEYSMLYDTKRFPHIEDPALFVSVCEEQLSQEA